MVDLMILQFFINLQQLNSSIFNMFDSNHHQSENLLELSFLFYYQEFFED
jgi:hypothetical protein